MQQKHVLKVYVNCKLEYMFRMSMSFVDWNSSPLFFGSSSPSPSNKAAWAFTVNCSGKNIFSILSEHHVTLYKVPTFLENLECHGKSGNFIMVWKVRENQGILDWSGKNLSSTLIKGSWLYSGCSTWGRVRLRWQYHPRPATKRILRHWRKCTRLDRLLHHR